MYKEELFFQSSSEQMQQITEKVSEFNVQNFNLNQNMLQSSLQNPFLPEFQHDVSVQIPAIQPIEKQTISSTKKRIRKLEGCRCKKVHCSRGYCKCARSKKQCSEKCSCYPCQNEYKPKFFKQYTNYFTTIGALQNQIFICGTGSPKITIGEVRGFHNENAVKKRKEKA